MQAISALAFIPFYNALVMQVPDMGLCMHVDILMNFMRAKFQMAT